MLLTQEASTSARNGNTNNDGATLGGYRNNRSRKTTPTTIITIIMEAEVEYNTMQTNGR